MSDQIPPEYARFQRPYDLRVLEAVADAPFNLLHVCGTGILFEEFVDYSVSAWNWAIVQENPSLSAVHHHTGRAVVGGLPAKPTIASTTGEMLAERARAAMREMDGRWLLVGPDCSINPDTPEWLLHAVGAAVRGGLP
jgi:uroporphyrinogen decarboxylase